MKKIQKLIANLVFYATTVGLAWVINTDPLATLAILLAAILALFLYSNRDWIKRLSNV